MNGALLYAFVPSLFLLPMLAMSVVDGRGTTSEYNSKHLFQVPVWNKLAVSSHQQGDAALELSMSTSPLGHVQGRGVR